MRRVALAALAAAAALGCATAGADRAPAAPPPSFQKVRSLVLVRGAWERAGRPKDPLDGLDETLRARGFTTRVIELGERPAPDLQPLAVLFQRLEGRASATRGERFGVASTSEVGPDAGAVVARAGADAVATYHRLEGRTSLPPPVASPGPSPFPSGAPAVPVRGPQGAFALVDREGHVAIFAWG